MKERGVENGGACRPEKNAIQVLLDCSNSFRVQQCMTPARRQQQSICGWVTAKSNSKTIESKGSTGFRSMSNWNRTHCKTRSSGLGATGMKGISQYNRRKEVEERENLAYMGGNVINLSR